MGRRASMKSVRMCMTDTVIELILTALLLQQRPGTVPSRSHAFRTGMHWSRVASVLYTPSMTWRTIIPQRKRRRGFEGEMRRSIRENDTLTKTIDHAQIGCATDALWNASCESDRKNVSGRCVKV